jgi:hypothetical protein
MRSGNRNICSSWWNHSPGLSIAAARTGFYGFSGHYRNHMHECSQLAGMMTAREHRAVLVAMAQAWKLLAQFHCLAASPEYRHNQTLIPNPKVASM